MTWGVPTGTEMVLSGVPSKMSANRKTIQRTVDFLELCAAISDEGDGRLLRQSQENGLSGDHLQCLRSVRNLFVPISVGRTRRNRKVLPRYNGLDFSLLWLGFGYRDRAVASVALGSRLHSDLQRTSDPNRHPRNRRISAHARRGCLRLDAHNLKNCIDVRVSDSDCGRTPVAIFLCSERSEGLFSNGFVDLRQFTPRQ